MGWKDEIKLRIQETLEYFVSEFPADEYPDVWKSPVSGFAGGITPIDLHDILQLLE